MMERLKRGWPILIVAAAIVWQFGAPLLGRVWFFEDIAAYFVPLYAAAAQSMKLGEFPTWALGAWSGQPLVGDPQLGLFYPLNWLWMLLHPARAYAWLQLVHAIVGAAGMWTLARARGRSTTAAALAALTLAVGAFFVLELRHAMFVATTAWMPWILWGIERLQKERSISHTLFVAFIGALALLAGGWSMLVWGALVVVVYAGAALARTIDRRARLALAGALAAAALVAVALATVQIAPALAHARLSPRALGTTPEFAASYGWPSWRYVVTLFAPTWYGDVGRGTYDGADNQWELCGYGIGVVGGLLALASLRLRERRGERLALLALTIVACVVARGVAQPLLAKLPLFSSLRCPARALYVWTLMAPLLAADGLDAIADAMAAHRRAWLRGIALVAVGLELALMFYAENPATTIAVADAHPEAVEWLRHRGRPGRATNDVHLGNPFHNMGLRWRFESAGGYHSLPIWRYLHLLWIANHGAPYPHAQLGDDLTGQGLWRFSSPIVNLLSVQWVVAPHEASIDVPGWTRALVGSDGVDLWQNHNVFPRALIVYAAERVADDDAAARAVAAATWDPSRRAVVEEDVGLPAASPFGATTPIQFIREGSQMLALEVQLARPGLVVVGEPWYPGWRVTVDGKPAPNLRVDYALRGVRVDRGTHFIEWQLTCPPLRLGGAITLLTLLGCAVLTSVDARRRRRRARTA